MDNKKWLFHLGKSQQASPQQLISNLVCLLFGAGKISALCIYQSCFTDTSCLLLDTKEMVFPKMQPNLWDYKIIKSSLKYLNTSSPVYIQHRKAGLADQHRFVLIVLVKKNNKMLTCSFSGQSDSELSPSEKERQTKQNVVQIVFSPVVLHSWG